jgi:hypothetical protein
MSCRGVASEATVPGIRVHMHGKVVAYEADGILSTFGLGGPRTF